MTEGSVLNIAGLLLAAGGSSRLGHPKQLVEFEGKTLIRRAAEALVEAGCSPVIVVLGAETELSRKELSNLEVLIVENPYWAEGMGSSIGSGIGELRNLAAPVDAVLISTCDQPKISADDLRKFPAQFLDAPAPIIAAEYDGVRGVPALFSAEMFEVLEKLTGDKGARELIRTHASTRSIRIPKAAIDIDTSDDIQQLAADQ